MTSGFKKIGKFIITNDGAFAIRPEEYADLESFDHRDSIGLYIREDLQLVDSPLKRLMSRKFVVSDEKIYIIGRVKYRRFMFYRTLTDKRIYKDGHPIDDGRFRNENDCLKFAESMSVANDTLRKNVFDKLVRADSSPCVYRSKDVPLLFGLSDATNIKILTKSTAKSLAAPRSRGTGDSVQASRNPVLQRRTPSSASRRSPSTSLSATINDDAFPSPGEAYAIVRKKLALGSAPYHIAYVLYTNNGVNITLEASADSGPDYYPRFGFYDTKNTFHKELSDLYKNGTTIVLQSRPIDDFLRELANE